MNSLPTMLRRRAAVLLVGITLLGFVSAIWQVRRTDQAMTGSSPYILVDPGHGGMDGGAVAADGTQEKAVNLAISLPLADLLRVFGYTVRTTRDTDVSIHDAGAATIKEKKVSDIHNRLALAQSARLTVSIHQNQFPQAQYSGTQVFYSPNNPESEGLAACIRESVLTLLQPGNNRQLKKGGSSIYLLHHATPPAVLVECGFLSNPTEREMLKTPAYQQQMAFAIAGGVLRYAP